MDEISQQILQQLNDEIRALNDSIQLNNKVRMSSMSQEEKERVRNSESLSRHTRTVYENSSTVDRSTDAYRSNLESAQLYDKAMRNFVEELNRGFNGLTKLFNNVISQDPSRSFDKYSDSVKTLGSAVGQTAEIFLGPFGKALNFAIQGLTTVGGLYAKQTDVLLKANDALTKIGTAGSFTSAELLQMANKAGITTKNFEVFLKPLQSLGPVLTSLGNTSGDGVKAFSKLIAISDDTRESYQRAGVSQEELIQNQADYLKLQRLTGTSLKNELRDKEVLQRTTLEYTDKLLALSAITGENVDTIKQRQQEARSAVNFQISQQLLKQQADNLRTYDKEGAKLLDKEFKSRNEFIDAISSLGDSQMTAAVQARLATGTWTEQSQYLARMGVPMEKFEEALRRGADGTETAGHMLNSFNNRMTDVLSATGRAIVFSEENAKLFGQNKKSLELYGANVDKDMVSVLKETKAQIEEARKKGTDPSKDIRANMTTAEIKVGVMFDKLTDKGNILTHGFTGATFGATALGVAAIAAAAYLGKLATGGLLASGANAVKAAMGLPGTGGIVPNAAKSAGGAAAAGAAWQRMSGSVAQGGSASNVAGRSAGSVEKLARIGRVVGPAALIGATIASIDASVGVLGVGQGQANIDQDEKNWNRMSAWEKVQSGIARSIEKIGSIAFMGNMANQARIDRINSETKYLDKKIEETSTDKEKKPTDDLDKNKIDKVMVMNKNTDPVPVSMVDFVKNISGLTSTVPNTSFTGQGLKPPSDFGVNYLQKLAMVESSGNRNAGASTSTAKGLFQFTEGTWRDTVKSMGLNYSLEDRFDPAKSTQVADYFTKQNKNYLESSLGRTVNDVELYMSHFLGKAGAAKFLAALNKNPNALASEGADINQINSNPNIFKRDGQLRTLQEVYDLMSTKLNKASKQIETGKISDDVKNLGSPDIKQGRTGGSFSGPESGYYVELHGEEIVLPKNKIESVTKQDLGNATRTIFDKLNPAGLRSVNGIIPTTPGFVKFDYQNETNFKNLADGVKSNFYDTLKTIQTDFKSVINQTAPNKTDITDYSYNNQLARLAEKLDTMIDKLSQSNDTQNKILMYTKV